MDLDSKHVCYVLLICPYLGSIVLLLHDVCPPYFVSLLQATQWNLCRVLFQQPYLTEFLLMYGTTDASVRGMTLQCHFQQSCCYLPLILVLLILARAVCVVTVRTESSLNLVYLAIAESMEGQNESLPNHE